MSSDLPTIVNCTAEENDDFMKLFATFNDSYQCPPSFYVHAPGRVNLIGEHIDYCGYAVLPMAIEQCILMAVTEDSTLSFTFTNTDPQYETFSCSAQEIKINMSQPKWYNYVLAGILGIKEHMKWDTMKGMKLAVCGNIPPGAGLSSSSALVCAAALACAHINDCKLSKMVLANICAKCEQYVGTQGGGMDQAICFNGEAGAAKLIEFNPLRIFDVTLPRGCKFVIANSLATINKAATSHYNTRVVECRLACKILSRLLGHDWTNISRLSELQHIENATAKEMAKKVLDHLHPEPYTRNEVCNILDITVKELVQDYLTQNTSHLEEFKLFQRSLHVYSESQRVYDFKNLCETHGNQTATLLGNLMNLSHSSCRDDYECSHPEVDQLVDVCIKAGALGSRLTGAGWGGCTVSLVHEENVEAFMDEVTEEYYNKYAHRKDNISSNLFCSSPANGVLIYKV